jgi:hypothetical protein
MATGGEDKVQTMASRACCRRRLEFLLLWREMGQIGVSKEDAHELSSAAPSS